MLFVCSGLLLALANRGAGDANDSSVKVSEDDGRHSMDVDS